jgi:hypothetical protein
VARVHPELNADKRIWDGVEGTALLEGPPDLACSGEDIDGTAKVSVVNDVFSDAVYWDQLQYVRR